MLVACGRVEPLRRVPADVRHVEGNFEQAWEAAVRTLTERGFDVQRLDPVQGMIETGWLTINSEYTATMLVTKWEDRYCACGHPALGQAFRVKQARLALQLQRIQPGETGLQIAAAFRTQRYSNALLWADRQLGEVACSSRGRLEEELMLQIQLRALTDRIERLRRGAP